MDELGRWLEERFHGYQVKGGPLKGSYGLVFVMETTKDYISPRQFAVKTVNPRVLLRRNEETIRKNFERELRVWLQLPTHPNVLRAGALDFAPAPDELKNLWPILPLVRMQYCDESLLSWTKAPNAIPIEDRLLAVAQICNGLMWLYEHGVEGHADLKPDNVLMSDWRRAYSLKPGNRFPSSTHPWQIRVADLGWANAWRCSGGEFNLGWRPYCAPERLNGVFIPEKSDVFAIGVIACELLQGSHPAGRLTSQVATWNVADWEKWAATGERHVNRISSERLRMLVEACLRADPASRPKCSELKNTVEAILEEEFELSAEILDIWTDHFRKLPGNRHAVQAAWGARQLAQLSQDNLSKEINLATSRIITPSQGAEQAYDWLETSKTLAELHLQRGELGDAEAAARIAEGVVRFVIDRFDDLDLREVSGLPWRAGPDDLVGFDRWEPLWSYAISALSQLRRAHGGVSDLADSLAEMLDSKRQV